MTDSSSVYRSPGVMMMVAIAAGAIGLSACRRPPTVAEVDGALAGPFSCTDWTKVASTPFPNTYKAIWGSGPDDVYFLHRNISSSPYKPSTSEIQHCDGKTVTTVTTSSTSSSLECKGLWGSSASDVYAATVVGLLHFDGAAWTKVAGLSVGAIQDIWGTGPDNVYVAGSGKVGRFDGKSWSVVLSVNGVKFNAVWGSGSDDIFAVGHSSHNGKIYHFDGKTWSLSLSRPWSVVSAVWGTGSSNVVAVGYMGGASFILRFDGQYWSNDSLPWHETSIDRLTQVWGHSSSRIFASGVDTLLGWDGQRWKSIDVPSGTYNNIQGLWGSGTSLFVAANEWGGAGAVWRATCSQ